MSALLWKSAIALSTTTNTAAAATNTVTNTTNASTTTITTTDNIDNTVAMKRIKTYKNSSGNNIIKAVLWLFYF